MKLGDLPNQSFLSNLAVDLCQFQTHKELLKNKQIVYFVGLTGSGKSVIINHLMGNTLKENKYQGRKMLVLDDETGHKPQIGLLATQSCTSIPMLYEIPHRDKFLLCDTAGYADTRPTAYNCQLLNQLYLTNAKSIAAIVMVINKHDILSQKGANLVTFFQQLERITNYEEIKKRMLFMINYKNVNVDSLEDLFLQVKQMECKAMQGQGEHPIESLKTKFFSAIFDKQCYMNQPDLKKFSNRVIICTKQQLLKNQSTIKEEFFNKVCSMQGAGQMSLRVSNGRAQLIRYLMSDILSKQNSFLECFQCLEVYKKAMYIQSKFWDPLNVEWSSNSQKARILNDTLFSQEADIVNTKEIILQLQARLSSFELIKDRLFKSLEFELDDTRIQDQTEFTVNVNVQYEIKNIVKELVGYVITDETISLEEGKYYARVARIGPGKHRSIKVQSVASYGDRDKVMTGYFKRQKDKLQHKINTRELMQSLPIYQQLRQVTDLISKTKDQQLFNNFVDKYSLRREQVFRKLPTLNVLETYECELRIYNTIVQNAKTNSSLVSKTPLDRLKAYTFLNFEGKKGFCCINYHLIQEPIRLKCGHEYEKYCYKRYFSDKDSTVTKDCVVCRLSLDQEVVTGEEMNRYSNRFKQFFKTEYK